MLEKANYFRQDFKKIKLMKLVEIVNMMDIKEH